jgi:hypothetical protein
MLSTDSHGINADSEFTIVPPMRDEAQKFPCDEETSVTPQEAEIKEISARESVGIPRSALKVDPPTESNGDKEFGSNAHGKVGGDAQADCASPARQEETFARSADLALQAPSVTEDAESETSLSTTKRSLRVSFKETPEEFRMVVSPDEDAAWEFDEDSACHDGALPADMSRLLAQCEEDDDASDDDADELALVTTNEKAKEPSGWDSGDEDDQLEGPTGNEDRKDACGAPQQLGNSFVEAKVASSASSVPKLSATDNLLDDLVGMVLGADASAPAPFRGSATHSFVQGLHCTGCDFQVMRIENSVWSKGAGYMFFRNNYPNVMRLRKNLTPQKGCSAFCCQCSWKSADATANIVDVADGLRWRKIGS